MADLDESSSGDLIAGRCVRETKDKQHDFLDDEVSVHLWHMKLHILHCSVTLLEHDTKACDPEEKGKRQKGKEGRDDDQTVQEWPDDWWLSPTDLARKRMHQTFGDELLNKQGSSPILGVRTDHLVLYLQNTILEMSEASDLSSTVLSVGTAHLAELIRIAGTTNRNGQPLFDRRSVVSFHEDPFSALKESLEQRASKSDQDYAYTAKTTPDFTLTLKAAVNNNLPACAGRILGEKGKTSRLVIESPGAACKNQMSVISTSDTEYPRQLFLIVFRYPREFGRRDGGSFGALVQFARRVSSKRCRQ